MRWILFSVITVLFVVISIVTILALFFGIGELKEQYEQQLVAAFILETAGALFGLFYSLFGLKPSAQHRAYKKVEKVTEDMADMAMVEHKRARLHVSDVDIGGLQGHWRASWYLEGDHDPYVEDDVWIDEIKGNEVYGRGKDNKGTYEFEGLHLRGVLTLVYKYTEEGYSLAGVIVLKVGPRSKTARGKWYGYLVEDEINGGKVVWSKV